MPHISKRKLESRSLENLYKELMSILSKVNQRNEISDELFTKTEKIMLAKRLAAIQMIAKKIPTHDIADILSMSPSTINIMSVKYEEGNYSNLVTAGKLSGELMDLIEFILSGGGIMPPITGKSTGKRKISKL